MTLNFKLSGISKQSYKLIVYNNRPMIVSNVIANNYQIKQEEKAKFAQLLYNFIKINLLNGPIQEKTDIVAQNAQLFIYGKAPAKQLFVSFYGTDFYLSPYEYNKEFHDVRILAKKTFGLHEIYNGVVSRLMVETVPALQNYDVLICEQQYPITSGKPFLQFKHSIPYIQTGQNNPDLAIVPKGHPFKKIKLKEATEVEQVLNQLEARYRDVKSYTAEYKISGQILIVSDPAGFTEAYKKYLTSLNQYLKKFNEHEEVHKLQKFINNMIREKNMMAFEKNKKVNDFLVNILTRLPKDCNPTIIVKVNNNTGETAPSSFTKDLYIPEDSLQSTSKTQDLLFRAANAAMHPDPTSYNYAKHLEDICKSRHMDKNLKSRFIGGARDHYELPNIDNKPWDHES